MAYMRDSDSVRLDSSSLVRPFKGIRRRDVLPPAVHALLADPVMATPPTIAALSGATTITTGTTWYPLKNGVIGSTRVDTSAPRSPPGCRSPSPHARRD